MKHGEIVITKMDDGTYKAWTNVKEMIMQVVELTLDADGNTPEEAEKKLLDKIGVSKE